MEIDPEVFKNSIQSLLKLQTLDAELFQINAEEKAPSGEYRDVKQGLLDAQKALRIAERSFREVDRERRALELKLITLREDIKKSEEKRRDVRNTAEEFAANKEVENFTSRIKEAEDMMKEREAKSNEKKEIRDSKKKTNDELQEKFNELESAREEKLKGLTQKKESLTAERDSYISKVDDLIFTMYERIQQHRKGSGVSVLNGGICQSCFVAITPQMSLKIEKMNELLTCPSCSRILYPEEIHIETSPPEVPDAEPEAAIEPETPSEEEASSADSGAETSTEEVKASSVS